MNTDYVIHQKKKVRLSWIGYYLEKYLACSNIFIPILRKLNPHACSVAPNFYFKTYCTSFFGSFHLKRNFMNLMKQDLQKVHLWQSECGRVHMICMPIIQHTVVIKDVPISLFKSESHVRRVARSSGHGTGQFFLQWTVISWVLIQVCYMKKINTLLNCVQQHNLGEMQN